MNATVRLGDALTLMARITRDDGTCPPVSTVTGMTLAVTNTTAAGPTTTTTLVPSAVLTDTPRLTDWHEDDVGYDLAVPLAPGTFPMPGNYAVVLTLTTDTPTTLTWSIQVRP